MKQAEAAEVFVMAQSFFDFVLRVKTQNECSWTHHAPSKATGSLMFLSHWSSYLFELQVMWCQRLLTIFRSSNCHYYQPPCEKNGGVVKSTNWTLYILSKTWWKRKNFTPEKSAFFVLQLHRVAFCLDELECAPCGTGSSQVYVHVLKVTRTHSHGLDFELDHNNDSH